MTDKVLELGTFEETRNGVPLKFKITTVPSEIIEDVIDHMITYFIPREPLCEHTKLLNDSKAIAVSKVVWRKLIGQGAAMVALAERSGPLKDRIVGANITYISSINDPKTTLEEAGEFAGIYEACEVALHRANLFERFGVDKFLSAFGLSVDPKYSGYHIGERLLQCRKPLSQHFGLKITGTIFTASSSQYLSKKIGFKVIYEEKYSDFRSDDGKLFFEGLPGKFEYSVLLYD